MSRAYSDPSRESDPHALPDVEVFYVSAKEAALALRDAENGAPDEYTGPTEEGWYWWPCFPGCLPDGCATGPFTSEAEAVENAQDGNT